METLLEEIIAYDKTRSTAGLQMTKKVHLNSVLTKSLYIFFTERTAKRQTEKGGE